jgi:hypothetical protein
MATLMLLFPLLLITTPVKVFNFRFCIFDFQSLLFLPYHCFDSGNITFYISEGFGILQFFRNRL